MATQASTTNHSTQGPQRTAVTDAERTIGQIVSDAATNAQALVRDEIALAKAEINADVQKGVKTGIGFGIAAFFGIFAFMMFLFAAAWGIATVLPTWAAFLIVGGVLLLITIIGALFGMAQMKKIKGKPEQAIAAAQRTQHTLTDAANPKATTPRR
ncbi:phage holin family protein [Kytococcus sedentarius]|uniref:phage holin family protein n=1 Tax=Kytococcus sedentarius TaxID=1276 RepID=UPI00385102BB